MQAEMQREQEEQNRADRSEEMYRSRQWNDDSM